MAGMRSSFEKWEPNDVAHLISMNCCGCRLQESQLQRANVKASKSVAINPRSDSFQAVRGQLDGCAAVDPCHSLSFHLLCHDAFVQNVFSGFQMCLFWITPDVAETISKMFFVPHQTIEVASLP